MGWDSQISKALEMGFSTIGTQLSKAVAGPPSCFLHIFAPSLHNTNTDRAIRQHWNLECVHKSQKGSKHRTGTVSANISIFIHASVQLYMYTSKTCLCSCGGNSHTQEKTTSILWMLNHRFCSKPPSPSKCIKCSGQN